jgi:gliding motility-associated lipoprotein GldH
MMNRNIIASTILAGLLLFIFSCDRSMIYDDFEKIENHSWKWEDSVNFSVDVEDTLSMFNILVQLRHTTDYPLSNLYMFVHVYGPGGQQMTDTINFTLAENSGKWIGKGLGNIREISYLYKKNTLFPQAGNYKISIEQAMRIPEVPVKEIGLRIEKTTKQ